MIRKILHRVRVNFRTTRTERAANASYSQYHQRIEKFFKKVPIWNKKGKQI